MKRWVLLADMNCFFASCHMAIQPELADKEVIVAGDPKKRTGIVLAASYPAKARGIKTGMALWEAQQLCPEGIFFKPDYPLYIDTSTRILKIMRDFTDQIEPFSIDEAFADLTGVIHLFGPPEEIGRKLKERIRSEVGVMCSVGIGPNKLIAKLAAGLQKPNGLTIVNSLEEYRAIFYGKPVRKLFGVGSRYEKHFRYLNIFTIGDLANYPVEVLKRRWGKNGELLWYCARGIDNSPVTPGSLDVHKSIGQQKTVPRDLRGFQNIKVVMYELSEIVARRARQGGYVGRTVFLTLRDPELNFLSRSLSLPGYTDLAEDVFQTATRLLHTHWHQSWPVRLVGITLSNLKKGDFDQYDLFGEKEKKVKLARACDAIKDRFGDGAVFRGISLTEASIIGKQR